MLIVANKVAYVERLTAAPLHSKYPEGTVVEAKVNNPTQVELMATISPFNSKFNSFTMYDDGLLGDAIANDGIYTAELPYLNSGEEIKFYVRSHNNNAISLSPQRAEYEFYTFHPN